MIKCWGVVESECPPQSVICSALGLWLAIMFVLLNFWPVSVVKISQHSPTMGLLPPIPCSWLFPVAEWEVGKLWHKPSTFSDFSEALGSLLCPHKPWSWIHLGIQRDLWICLEIHMADLGWFRDATSCLCLYKHLLSLMSSHRVICWFFSAQCSELINHGICFSLKHNTIQHHMFKEEINLQEALFSRFNNCIRDAYLLQLP